MTEALWIGALIRSGGATNTTDTVFVLLLLHAVYLTCVYLRLKARGSGPPVWLIAGAALVFRITLAPMPPNLSDDLRRYQWEGRIQTGGLNPYTTRPEDLGEMDVPGKDFKAIYGPLAEIASRAAYSVSGGRLLALKASAMLADLLLIALLARMAPGSLLIYAWSPVAVMEFWGQGHNDALAILFLAGALLLPGAGLWLGLAGAAKWWPLALVPALARNWRDWLVAAVVPAILMIPFLPGLTTENARFASGFLGGWRNNDSIYSALLWLTGDQYPAKYAAFAILGAAALGVRWLPWPRERKALAVVLVMLAVSANVHPWYLAWPLPFLVFHPLPWAFLWAALMPLAYESVIRWSLLGEWTQSPEIRWMIYIPVAAMAVAPPIWRRSTSKREPVK